MTDSPTGGSRRDPAAAPDAPAWRRPRGRERYPDPVEVDAPPTSAPASGTERRLALALDETAAVRPPAQLPPVTHTPATRAAAEVPAAVIRVPPARTPAQPTPTPAESPSAQPAQPRPTPARDAVSRRAVSTPVQAGGEAEPTRASGRRLVAGGRFDGPLPVGAERTRVGSHAAPGLVDGPPRSSVEPGRPRGERARRRGADAAPVVVRSRPAVPLDLLPADGGRALVMGILNVTPDSFSDGGRWVGLGAALDHARELVAAGADLVDVGGESTRPGASRVDPLEEQRRVLPVVRELASEGVRVSVDTMNASTARAAVEAGADVINDVSGGLADDAMADVAAETERLFVAMHWRGHLEHGRSAPDYGGDVARRVRDELAARVDALAGRGVRLDRLVLDPGVGFSKDAAQNWRVLAALPELARLGQPLLVGASRKRFLGELLPDGAPPEHRDLPTAVVSVLAAQAGVWAVRVHDAAGTRVALDVLHAWQGAAVPARPARHA